MHSRGHHQHKAIRFIPVKHPAKPGSDQRPPTTFRILFVFVVLSHARRRVLHFFVTEHPAQEWTGERHFVYERKR